MESFQQRSVLPRHAEVKDPYLRLGGGFGVHDRATEPKELADLRAKFTKAMDRATEALTIFWPSYRHQLEALKPKAQSQGNLEGVLAVEAEMKLADKQSIGKNAKYEPLKICRRSTPAFAPTWKSRSHRTKNGFTTSTSPRCRPWKYP